MEGERTRAGQLEGSASWTSVIPHPPLLVHVLGSSPLPHQALLALIGDTLMLHLLLHTSVFMPLSGKGQE